MPDTLPRLHPDRTPHHVEPTVTNLARGLAFFREVLALWVLPGWGIR